MTFDEFHNKYLEKKVGTGQCVALVKKYIDDVLEVKSRAIGNAKDYYENFENTYLINYCTKIENTADFVPIKGDIVVWNSDISSTQNYGHIAICTGVGDTHSFQSFDQNWSGKYGRDITHSYNHVYGVLRPNDQSKVTGIIPQPTIDIKYFDTDLYNSLYVDLQEAFSGDENFLKNHYNDFGKKEGRIASYIFDPAYYLNKYSDLKEAFGTDYEAAYNHFIEFGVKEGRQASQVFDVRYYIENNQDIKEAFGENFEAVINHFLSYGINEWRSTSDEFNVITYKNNYQDLQEAFGDNCKYYFKHYITNGRNESRKCV